MKKNWWKEGVIYQIYPRSFKDTNGDGIGDLNGIIEKVDYLAELGIDMLWLCPIYDSPNDDNGYDISDYRSIHPDFGDLEIFKKLLDKLHSRNIKLLMDLVVNHTSDEHHWFKESQKSLNNPYRDYYIWKKPSGTGAPNNWKAFFGGSAWEYDDATGEYYLHYFTKKQPDLNWENPKVRAEVYNIMKYWLDIGIDGFRMDVISLISKRVEYQDSKYEIFAEAIENEFANGPRIHEFLKEMHSEVMSKYDMMTIGEGVGIPPALANAYVGADRNELNMIYHFGHMFLDHGPKGKYDYKPASLVEFKNVFNDWDEALGSQGWTSIYLDNHDFSRMVSRFGNDQEYRELSAKLLISLLLTLRGTPSIYQGDEIGMTNVKFDNIDQYDDVETRGAYKDAVAQGWDMAKFMEAVHIQSRDNSRTPMQWDNSENAGFSDGTPWLQANKNYDRINAQSQLNDPKSILNFYKRLLHLRKQHPTWIYGQYESIDNEHPHIYKYERWDEHSKYLILLNFSDRIQEWSSLHSENVELIVGNYESGQKTGTLRAWESLIYKVK
jgi:oligo-1,6-glucosidase